MGIYTPSTQTGGLSENGMHWWNDEHMGIYTPSTHTGGLSRMVCVGGTMSTWGFTPPRPTRADCRKMACIGGTMSTWELCTHVMRPIYARFVEGRCPYFDILPLQGAIPFKPESWGETQGVAALRSALPWAEIPLPLQGDAASKPLKYNVVCVLIRATRPQNH